MQVHLRRERPTAAIDPGPEERRAVAALHIALLLEGVYAAPRGMLNLSTSMSDPELQQIAGAYERAFERIGGLFEGMASEGTW